MSNPTSARPPAMVLVGVGGYLPERIVTNDDLSKVMDTSDEWIASRTGIRERRVAAEGQTSLHLAVEAGREALKATNDGRTDVDALVLATMTPDRLCPATAPDVAAELGLGHIPAFDVSAVCSGFVYAAATAQGLIAAGTAQRVLIIGTEVMSSFLNPEDRNTAVIFGDGAGAVVVRAGEPDEPGAFGPFDLGADGGGSDLITVNGFGGRTPPEPTRENTDDDYLFMAGREVYRQAIPAMAESSRVALAARGWELGDLDAVIGHQANVRILDAVCRELGIDTSISFVNLDKVGNTSGASIPLAMTHAHQQGFTTAGQRVLLTAFGAGLTWGSGTLIWPELPEMPA
ncbi:beta-ketoacyl-ACP synthase III [Euzebya tangerina]|uniref:beta-ketoacyl-ACP synthase III n=1 Tax=Euzebya tangerina TaxID=591198 RepID=UPI00196B20A1|nr:beta-ketoacyl-ACP synthase III [Euzebya tangerina]